MTEEVPTPGECIRRAREAAGMTRPELAVKSEVGLNTLWRYETGKTTPKEKAVERIASALGTTPAGLMSPSVHGTPPQGPALESPIKITSGLAKLHSVSTYENAPPGAGPRWNLSDEDRSLAIRIYLMQGEGEQAAELTDELSRRVHGVNFVWNRERYVNTRLNRGSESATAAAAQGFAMAVINATGRSVALHEHDFGGVEYSRARLHDPSAPSETAVALAVAILGDENAAEDESSLAHAVLERARVFADKYRAPYTEPFFK